MKIEKLIEVIKGNRTFIQTHNFPDPDAIASAFGLQVLLREFGIEATICYKGEMEKLNTVRMLKSLDITMVNIRDIPDMTQTDYIITVDAQKYNENLTDFIGDEVACIDHHPTFVECSYAYSDIRRTGACSSIIAEYYFECGKEIPCEVATALIYGIKMDTSDLRREVTQFDIEMFGRLFPYADAELLNKLQLNTMEFSDLHAYGAAIENIKVYGNVGFAFIPFDCPDALVAMVSDFILALDVIEFSVIYAQRQSGYKFSVRSELVSLNAGMIINSALCGIGSGGGHASFAGGFIPIAYIESIGETIHDDICSRFLTAIDKSKASAIM